MTQNTEKNRKIILAERPFGVPDEKHTTPGNFRKTNSGCW